MFNKTELDTTVEMVRSKKLCLDQPFTAQLSNDIRSEAEFVFFRGAKKHYNDSAHFWICCINWLEERRIGYQLLMTQRYPDHVLVANLNTNVLIDAYSLYKTISPESFHLIIEEYSLWLKNATIPHTYYWEGQLRRSMQMNDEWNDQAFIAETENEFLAFHWETSA